MSRAVAIGAAVWCGALFAAADAAAQEGVVLRGRVIESGAGTAVSEAEVRAVCHDVGVLTAEDGTFTLRLPAGVHDVVIEHLAYAGANARVTATETADLTVRLTPRAVALGELVVTASRRVQQLRDAAVATEVVGREEIARSGAADLSAVLVERTGVATEGGHPVGSGVMLQGLGAERVLVLIDGQPYIGRISGGLDLARIPTSMVDRVEVIKGPQSTLYGSEAMGGVVNIITRAPTRDASEARLGLTGGSHDRLDIAGNVLGSLGAVSYTLDAGRRTIELVPGHAGDAGTFATRWDGGAQVRWQARPTLSLHAGALLLDETQRWRSGVLYHFADNVQWGGRAGATYTNGAHRWSPTLYATEFRHLARRSTLPQPVAGSDDATEVQRLVEAELLYSHAAGRLAIDGGIEARRESIHSDRVAGTDRVLHTVEPFAQATWSGDSWSIVPGARMSWSEQWGVHITPRIAALLRPAEEIALRLSIGQGFRAPSFKELYMEFLNSSAGAGYRVRGNTELQPETSRNVSGSVEWAGERLHSRVQLFYNRFEDFIEARQVPADGDLTLYMYGNVDDGETYGAELDVGATWGGLRVEAGYGWLQARDRTTGETLLGRPEHSARAALTYALPFGLRTSISGVHTGVTPAARSDAGVITTRRAALTRIDVRAAQVLPRGFELSIGVDNIADASLDNYPGHLGRQIYIGVAWLGGRRP